MEARARCIDLGRSEASRHRRELLGEHFVSAQPVEDAVLNVLLNAELRAALMDLPYNQREAIELAYLGGIPYRAVAAYLEIPEGTVKSRIRCGLQRLRASTNPQCQFAEIASAR